MCLVDTLNTPTEVDLGIGTTMMVSIREREPRSTGLGLASSDGCAIITAIMTAIELGATEESPLKTKEFCRKCKALVSMTVYPK